MDAKKVSAFKGTKEQEEQLLKVIENHAGQQGALMPILQEAQEIYGYLPIEVQQIIAEKGGFSMAEIYGVVTFYTQFSLYPKGEYKVAVCLGTACFVKGSEKVLDRIVERKHIKNMNGCS